MQVLHISHTGLANKIWILMNPFLFASESERSMTKCGTVINLRRVFVAKHWPVHGAILSYSKMMAHILFFSVEWSRRRSFGIRCTCVIVLDHLLTLSLLIFQVRVMTLTSQLWGFMMCPVTGSTTKLGSEKALVFAAPLSLCSSLLPLQHPGLSNLEAVYLFPLIKNLSFYFLQQGEVI